MRIIILLLILLSFSCLDKTNTVKTQEPKQTNEQLIAMLDSIWTTEQQPKN